MRLYEASVCRLCAGEASRGTLLFEDDTDKRSPASMINAYLPIQVSNDGILPRIICPGCEIQLEATAQFLDLLISGQTKLKEYLKEENRLLKCQTPADPQDMMKKAMENGRVYTKDHPIFFQIENLQNEAKRKRGRPKKVTPLPEEPIAREEIEEKSVTETDVPLGKRKRTAPKRFNGIIQGDELDSIFHKEDNVGRNRSDIFESQNTEMQSVDETEPQIIGRVRNIQNNTESDVVMNKPNPGTLKKKGTVCYVCKICSLEFRSSRNYMAHLAEHQIRPNSSTDGAQLRVNTINVDRDNTAVQQEISKVVTSKDEITNLSIPDSLILHQVETSNRSVIKMIETGNSSTGEPKIRILDSDNFQCTECEKVFSRKQSCEVHVKAYHLGQRPFRCTHCGHSFSYKISLQRHMLSHASKENKAFACDICGKILKHPSSIVYHKKTEHNNESLFVCIKCGKSFKHRQLLRRHQIVHSNKRPFVCKICKSSFKTKSNLMNHRTTHSGIKKFNCEICSQKFAHKASLNNHLRTHAGEKPYVCSVCKKAFSRSGHLSEHMRTHTGEKPYSCDLCPRRFTTFSQRRLHMDRHTGEKRWLCQHCGKKFLNKESWKCHVMKHRGERPYACQSCGRRFTERWALRKHMRFHTGERPFSCETCGKTFADGSNFAKHKKTHCVPTEAPIVPETTDSFITENPIDVTDGPLTIRILDGDCGLYETALLTDGADGADGTLAREAILERFVDEEGNPIRLTFQEEARFTVAAPDGRLLQLSGEELILSADVEDGGDFFIDQ